MGIEPTAQAWEAWVLPLYDARAGSILFALTTVTQIRAMPPRPTTVRAHRYRLVLSLYNQDLTKTP